MRVSCGRLVCCQNENNARKRENGTAVTKNSPKRQISQVPAATTVQCEMTETCIPSEKTKLFDGEIHLKVITNDKSANDIQHVVENTPADNAHNGGD